MSDDISSIAPLAPEVSPLLEADPASLNEFISSRVNEIFNKPPLAVSDEDLMAMVEYYRRERTRFQIESAAKPPRAAKGTAAPKSKVAPKSVKEALAAMSTTIDLMDD